MEEHFIYKYMIVICTFRLMICDEETHIKQLNFYGGSEEAKISCNRSQAINITDIELINYSASCNRNLCNLTDDDRNHIDTCNGISTCEIPIDEMSPCITDKGFYSVDYSCQKNVYYDFEDDSYEWFLEENNWTVADAKNQNPSKDHTTGSRLGHYVLVETADSFKKFSSKLIQGSLKQCLTFYYYIRDANDSIILYIQHINGTNIVEVNVTRLAGSDMWHRMRHSIHDIDEYRIIIEGKGHNFWSAFAVDDISIINIDCQELRECDFESGWCNWIGPNQWQRIQGETPDKNTGPLTDHTTTDKGYYAYMEASDMSNRQTKSLKSPTYNGTGKMCFTFWYYIHGNNDMGSLRVYNKPKNKRPELIFGKSGNQGARWHAAYLDIHLAGEFEIFIQGQRGRGSKSDIAVDDISLFPGNCKGIVQHHQHCKSVHEQVELKECSKHYVSNIHVHFDPVKEFCKNFLEENANSFCHNSSYTVLCDAGIITRQHPSCFNLTSLVIDYTCTDPPKIPLINKESNVDSKGVIVGAVVGVLVVVGVVLGVLFILHRRRRNLGTSQNKNSTNDYLASWHSNSQPNHQTNHTRNAQTSKKGLTTIRASNDRSYGQGYDIAATKQTTNKQEIEYMNITTQKGNLIPHDVVGEYKILDPAETGFNRSNPNEYELASPVIENQDDNYAEPGAGVYDISRNNRHKVKETIYDHSVDDTYDISNRGRREDLGDYTYNHVFGKQTEDEYDIAGS